jgi:hypothetical protein
MAVTPSWLADEAIERTHALGDEMAKFLLRRSRQKKINPNAKVKPGRRLLKMLAELEARERGSGRGKP